MQSLRSKTLYHILPEFIERIKLLFPDIKYIEQNDKIFKEGYSHRAYLTSSDSSGVHVYFYNMTCADILRVIDHQFEDCSIKIKEYFNVIKIYNKLLYNIDSATYNIGVNLINNMDDSDRLVYKIKAINQKSSSILLMFNDYNSLSDKEENIDDDDDDKFTCEISFKNEEFYQYLLNTLNNKVSESVDITQIRSNNIQEHAAVIQMLKI